MAASSAGQEGAEKEVQSVKGSVIMTKAEQKICLDSAQECILSVTRGDIMRDIVSSNMLGFPSKLKVFAPFLILFENILDEATLLDEVQGFKLAKNLMKGSDFLSNVVDFTCHENICRVEPADIVLIETILASLTPAEINNELRHRTIGSLLAWIEYVCKYYRGCERV
jgi:hypothetical protein